MNNLILGSVINQGGEGKIHLIKNNPNQVAKIFFNPKLYQSLEQSFQYLTKLSDNFVKPLVLIKDNNIIIGFTMDFVDLSSFFPLSGLKYDDFAKKNHIFDKIPILSQIGTLIEKSVHNNDMCVGDLNPENILINSSQIKFIDVSSYQTPVTKHNDIIQPEIRDWAYKGIINKHTDYFSYAVLTFEILTGMHPFKGGYKGIDDNKKLDFKQKLELRQLQKISVLNPQVFTPKSYKRIQSKWLEDQYREIFENGDRFLIKFTQPVQIQVIKLAPISTDKISLKEFYNGSINNFNFNEDIIKINDSCYEAIGRGMFNKKPSADFYVNGHQYLLIDNELHLNNKYTKTNIGKLFGKVVQMGDWLSVNHLDRLKIINLSSVYKNILDYSEEEVLTKSFKYGYGIVQNFSQQTIMHIIKNKKPTTITSNEHILDFYQFGDYATVKYKDKNTNSIKFGYVYLENNNKVLLEIDDFKKSTIKDNTFIFEPDDQTINIIRILDMKKISEIACNICTKNSILHYNRAGLIILTEDKGYILNSN